MEALATSGGGLYASIEAVEKLFPERLYADFRQRTE